MVKVDIYTDGRYYYIYERCPIPVYQGYGYYDGDEDEIKFWRKGENVEIKESGFVDVDYVSVLKREIDFDRKTIFVFYISKFKPRNLVSRVDSLSHIDEVNRKAIINYLIYEMMQGKSPILLYRSDLPAIPINVEIERLRRR